MEILEGLRSYMTFDHVLETLLAMGFFGSLLPPVNEFLAKLYSNKFVRAGMEVADRLKKREEEGGELNEEQFNSVLKEIYGKVKTRIKTND